MNFENLPPSPLEEVFPPWSSGVRLFIKRDDLLHPVIQGNKWRKLTPLLQKMQSSGDARGVLSFGGAYSNHLHALAAAGRQYGFPTIGILRGSAADAHNPTLSFTRQCGMQLFAVPKKEYDDLKTCDLEKILTFIGLPANASYLLLPEGGDTPAALVGCGDIAVEIARQLPPDAGNPLYFCVPAGTGCTAAGVIAGAPPGVRTLIFPAAPYGISLDKIKDKLRLAGFQGNYPFEIADNMYPEKFAAMPLQLKDFVAEFYQQTHILLDPIYTSKMMFRLQEMMASSNFPAGTCVVALHTGGLQGWDGFGGPPL